MGEERHLNPSAENSLRQCTAPGSVDDEALAKIEESKRRGNKRWFVCSASFCPLSCK